MQAGTSYIDSTPLWTFHRHLCCSCCSNWCCRRVLWSFLHAAAQGAALKYWLVSGSNRPPEVSTTGACASTITTSALKRLDRLLDHQTPHQALALALTLAALRYCHPGAEQTTALESLFVRPREIFSSATAAAAATATATAASCIFSSALRLGLVCTRICIATYDLKSGYTLPPGALVVYFLFCLAASVVALGRRPSMTVSGSITCLTIHAPSRSWLPRVCKQAYNASV
jgi:hypothetical protein